MLTLRLRISDLGLRRASKHLSVTERLDRWRREIDGLDAVILSALELRARSVRDIGRYKKEHGLPILDPARERLILNRVCERKGLLPNNVRGEIFGTIIERMREWESTLD
jgi:chorismate mutase